MNKLYSTWHRMKQHLQGLKHTVTLRQVSSQKVRLALNVYDF